MPFLLFFTFLSYSLYALFSYSLTDPNLVLSNWPPYWNFQTWMWQTFFHNPSLLVGGYVVLIIALMAIFLLGVRHVFHAANPGKWLVALVVAASLPLFWSYNALSHDVFNYIFNAKMVMVYHADPHVKVALDFPEDDWLRFMHNTHTPAPYGYGWTLFSLVPYSVGLGKFVPTWLSFRGWSIFSLILLGLVLERLRQSQTFSDQEPHPSKVLPIAYLGLTLLHPLLLLEVISNAHNDLWMMVPALASLWLVGMAGRERKIPGKTLLWLALAVVLLGASISIKFASILLLPIWIWLLLRQPIATLVKKFSSDFFTNAFRVVNAHLPELASLAMLLPLLTDRSQQFHPWYFTWILVWLPFMKIKWWRRGLLVLSFSSLLRYVPWLWAGNFDGPVLLQQKMITWIPFIIFLLGVGVVKLLHRPDKVE